MPVIDSRSESKFDALIRTNKAEALISLIMATYNATSTEDKKNQISVRLKSAFELFRQNVQGQVSGAGTYGLGDRNINDQFESQYTMGYEMGIWQDGNFTLNPLALKVAQFEITVSDYIGSVLKNLFSYFIKNGNVTFHHFLYEVLIKADKEGLINKNIPKKLIIDTLPIDKNTEQGNLLFQYLIASNFFSKVDNENLKLSREWENRGNELISLCNLEYKNKSKEESFYMAKDKLNYALYVTKDSSIIYDIVPNINTIKYADKNRIKGGFNILLYGVPGSGKSWAIANDYCNEDSLIERVVFHPDYTNSDFVGQILPNVEDGFVYYKFTEGPFINLLRKSLNNPDRMYYLVIEEINRGNAPAIFGELFQLLDRDNNGESVYGITNLEISKSIFGESNHKIKIPSNMSIIGTMNTSDQNVFTLDTAFQRRWNMRLIKNSFDNHEFANHTILDTDVTWQRFCNVMNNIIVTKNNQFSSEDKRLGAYFVLAEELKFDSRVKEQDLSDIVRNQARLLNNRFAEKVLKYLWDDVFKFSRDEIFNSEYNSLEEVITHFNSINDSKVMGNDRFAIFNEEIVDSLINENM